MSGGVDSSVAAILLQKEDYDIIGVSLWIYNQGEEQIPDSLIEAQELARSLGIEHHIVDIRDRIEKTVIKYFESEYLQGRTPTACIKCNSEIKWTVLNEMAIKHNCAGIATGHYININKVDGTYYIHKAVDEIKDQSYFMWNLSQAKLAKMITPLGSYSKKEIKQLAIDFGIESIAKKKESMGVCFLKGQNYRDFLLKRNKNNQAAFNQGNVYDQTGNLLGKHTGFINYTIGQKKGFVFDNTNKLAVKKIDANSNSIYLSDNEELYTKKINVSSYFFHNIEDIKLANISTVVRGFGWNPEAYSKIEIIDSNNLVVRLDNPAWAISPGQPVVFYINDRLIGGGVAEFSY